MLVVAGTSNAAIHTMQAPNSRTQLSLSSRQLAGFYGSSKDIDMVESEKVMRAALDSGMTLLNTADFYTGFAPGEEVSGNIKLIGKPSSQSGSQF